MGLIDTMKEKIRKFLEIKSEDNSQIVITEKIDFFNNAAKNKIWYRGNGNELSELYSQLPVSPTMFWKATCTKGREIRKIHCGLPKLIVKVITNIVVNDFNGIDIEDDDKVLGNVWESISKENDFENKLIKTLVKKVLVIGDGAFKITFDKSINEQYPIIEYVSGDNIEFTYKRGRITEVIFTTKYVHKHKKYFFKESYGIGYIKYALYNETGNEININAIPQTEWCDSTGVKFEGNYMLAVPVIFGDSEQYEGRGESLFDGKTDCFDLLDEVISQWMDAIRAGRTREYIPEDLIPRNPDTGKIIEPNAFDNRYISIGNNMAENGQNKIDIEQPAIPHESYLSTYITMLDLCLQGIISPSTLGIDTKKLDNSEAQREKEKTTLYTRGNIIELLNEVIPQIVISAVFAYQTWNNQTIKVPEKISVKFGEYANPSFESQIETVAKGRTGGILSVESSVDELYGDTKDEEWKKQEVQRIKAEQGIVSMEEKSEIDDIGDEYDKNI